MTIRERINELTKQHIEEFFDIKGKLTMVGVSYRGETKELEQLAMLVEVYNEILKADDIGIYLSQVPYKFPDVWQRVFSELDSYCILQVLVLKESE